MRYPSLVADPYWQDPGIAARFGGILDAAAERAPGQAWELALMSGDAEWARELANGASTPEAVVEAWLGDSDALSSVFALADESPESAYLLSWASRLAAREGAPDR